MKQDDDTHEILDEQRQHWKNTYCEEPKLYGDKPSYSAIKAAKMFHEDKVFRILELGGGHGRDTLFFASRKFHVDVLDYCDNSINTIKEVVSQLHISEYVTPSCHDVRETLLYPDNTFDACYSHMLFCMALTNTQLEFVFSEVRRVLKPNGLMVYTVRNVKDAHYQQGVHRGEDMYEMDGFIVHFFSKEKVEALAKGFEVVGIEQFDEGELPRKLFLVTLRKS